MRPMPTDVKPPKGPKRELKLGNKLHDGRGGYPGQETWLKACFAFFAVILACGRRVGKSTFIPNLFMEEMTGCDHFYQAAYGSQGHPQSKDMFRACLDAWTEAGIVKESRADEGQDRWIELDPLHMEMDDGTIIRGHGGKVWFISLEQGAHRGFHGKGLDRAVIDEACLVPEEALTSTLLPMLVTARGKLLVTGSPFPDENGAIGWEWFQRWWESGNILNENRKKNRISFNAPTEANPHNPLEWCAEMRATARSHSEELCLYDGQFARDMGAVFDNLKTVFCLKATDLGNAWQVEEYKRGTEYVAGLDFGAKKDYSVLSIFTVEPHPRQVFLMRIQGPLHHQEAAIDRWMAAYHHPMLYVEGREGGAYIAPKLREMYGEGCREVLWASGGKWDKESAVLRGMDFFQQKAWSLIDVPWQYDEFRLFSRMKRGANSTGFKYSAPSGKHDDAVAATLYAAYGLPFVRDKAFQVEPEKPKTYSSAWWDLHLAVNSRAPSRQGKSSNLSF